MLGTDQRDMLVPKLPRRRYWSSRPGLTCWISAAVTSRPPAMPLRQDQSRFASYRWIELLPASHPRSGIP